MTRISNLIFLSCFFEHATHLSANVCQLSPFKTSFITRPRACVPLNESDMMFRDSLLHFYSASILKIIAQPYRTPILSIVAYHCFDWVSVKMQNSCIVTWLIVIWESILTLLITVMMRTEARTIVWTQSCCFSKVQAGCPPANEHGRNICRTVMFSASYCIFMIEHN